jgi:predicted nucleotidyltransferase
MAESRDSHPLTFDREAVADICRRWGIRELAIFGSALRSDFGPQSDIDLLVELEPDVVLGFRIFELEQELSGVFGGRRIDLVPRKYLHPLLRERVLSEAQVAYAA